MDRRVIQVLCECGCSGGCLDGSSRKIINSFIKIYQWPNAKPIVQIEHLPSTIWLTPNSFTPRMQFLFWITSVAPECIRGPSAWKPSWTICEINHCETQLPPLQRRRKQYNTKQNKNKNKLQRLFYSFSYTMTWLIMAWDQRESGLTRNWMDATSQWMAWKCDANTLWRLHPHGQWMSIV